MYDVVIIGQGLSGMLSAIWAKERGYRTAIVATGTGKIVQSTGVMDLIPGSDGGLKEWMELYQAQGDSIQKLQLMRAIDRFKAVTKRLGYPYKGNVESLTPIVTGSGHIKKTALYPETICQIPEKGNVVIVGFDEIVDFQPSFVKENIQKARPQLRIEAFKIQLGKRSNRTMNQLDAAWLLDQKEIRSHCIAQIKRHMVEKGMKQPDLFVFPASLGMTNWKETLQEFSTQLGGRVTETPGMPPNTTAIRLNNILKREAVKAGVRFYADTTVIGCEMHKQEIRSLIIKTSNQTTNISGKQFILASGGLLGGGLQVTPDGIKETALNLETDEFGKVIHCPSNLYFAGASKGMRMTQCGITGGVYSVLSSYESVCALQHSIEGVVRNA